MTFSTIIFIYFIGFLSGCGMLFFALKWHRRGITDTDRINWLESRPLPAEVKGGPNDGADAKFWGISAYDGTLRETIDCMINTGSERQKPVEYK
jgi:hypothetical protein